jgi:hypothetical protein
MDFVNSQFFSGRKRHPFLTDSHLFFTYITVLKNGFGFIMIKYYIHGLYNLRAFQIVGNKSIRP